MSAGPAAAPPSSSVPSPSPRRRRRFRLKKAAAHLAIFVCGIVIGATASGYFTHHLIIKMIGNPELMADRLSHRLDRELDLDDEQSEKVSAIIHAHAKTMTAIFSEISPRLSADFDQMQVEVGDQLTEEQKQKWDKRCQRMKNRFGHPAKSP